MSIRGSNSHLNKRDNNSEPPRMSDLDYALIASESALEYRTEYSAVPWR